jgi:hypothetical protein
MANVMPEVLFALVLIGAFLLVAGAIRFLGRNGGAG